MKALVGCGATFVLAAVLGFAAAGSAAAGETPAPEPSAYTTPPPPAPYVPPEPTVSVTCQRLTVHAVDERSVRISSTATDSEAGTPNAAVDYRYSGDVDYNFYNGAWAWNWTVEVVLYGGDLWTRSGTSTPCEGTGYAKGYVSPAKPTVNTTCGATLDDIRFPATRHVTYSHDKAAVYATLEKGWYWAEGSLGPPHTGWIMADPLPSNLSRIATIEGYDLLHPPAGCPHTVPYPNDPQPAGPRPTGPGVAITTPTETAESAPTPSSPAVDETAKPSPTDATPTAASPSPNPSATPVARGEQRVATTTGLGVAGGLAGACALATAGAFLVRRRLRPSPNAVVMDEAGGDEPTD